MTDNQTAPNHMSNENSIFNHSLCSLGKDNYVAQTYTAHTAALRPKSTKASRPHPNSSLHMMVNMCLQAHSYIWRLEKGWQLSPKWMLCPKLIFNPVLFLSLSLINAVASSVIGPHCKKCRFTFFYL